MQRSDIMDMIGKHVKVTDYTYSHGGDYPDAQIVLILSATRVEIVFDDPGWQQYIHKCFGKNLAIGIGSFKKQED
jgi:hypothetical protein